MNVKKLNAAIITVALFWVSATLLSRALAQCAEGCPKQINISGTCGSGQNNCTTACNDTKRVLHSGLFFCNTSSNSCTNCIGGGTPADCYTDYTCQIQADVEPPCRAINPDTFQEPLKQTPTCL